jgi:hypothetical protein
MKKDVSKFRPSGCKAYVDLNKEKREKGKHTPQTEAVRQFTLDSHQIAI